MSQASTKSWGDRTPQAFSRLRIRVLEGPDASRELEPETEGPVAIGSADGNELVLSDPTVSRYHIEVTRTKTGALVHDLGSLNGTWLHDARIESAELAPGTRIRLGQTVIELADGALLAEDVEEPQPIPGIIGQSRAMRPAIRTVRKLAPSHVAVLVEGETGTGKELFARAIHDLSPRHDAPFEVVDCGSLPATLIASELFGHERGAFTGADRQRLGAFERANKGTVFLDEIGEVPPQVQPALLGVLERKRFRRVGGDRDIAIDVRIVSATHRDLRADANNGTFRADLYFRLAAARIVIPSLRERPEDIELLVKYFAQEMTGEADEGLFNSGVLAALRAQRWSGNIRELKNVVETSLAMGEISLGDSLIPSALIPGKSGDIVSYKEARAQAVLAFEKEYLQNLIERCQGNASAAARLARTDRPWLLRLLRKHGLR